jgi:hypothetical protein
LPNYLWLLKDTTNEDSISIRGRESIVVPIYSNDSRGLLNPSPLAHTSGEVDLATLEHMVSEGGDVMAYAIECISP